MLLFVPIRNEGGFIEEESVLNRNENGALNTHSDKLQRMLKAKEKARQAQDQDVKGPDKVEEDDDDVGPQLADEATSAMHDVLELQVYVQVEQKGHQSS